MGALSLTASKTIQKKHYHPLVPGITHIPYPDCYRCPYGLCHPRCGTECVGWLENTLFQTTIPPEEVAAIFVEPIQGEGGYIVPPPEFHQELFSSRPKNTGSSSWPTKSSQGWVGRGRCLRWSTSAWNRDIIALAKGIASGMPLGAMIARADIMDWEAGSHASTFGGNPVSCRAALATIALLEEGLITNAEIQGERLMAGLRDLQKTYECMGDVRGKGLMVGVELVKDRETKERATAWRAADHPKGFRKGVAAPGVRSEHHPLLPCPHRERRGGGCLPDHLRRSGPGGCGLARCRPRH